MEKLIREADVLVENFAPGAMDRMGFTWEHIQELNPRIIFGSVKGFSEGSPYANLKDLRECGAVRHSDKRLRRSMRVQPAQVASGGWSVGVRLNSVPAEAAALDSPVESSMKMSPQIELC
jgi:hypothetical protein